MKRTLVTGASGFVGANLIRRLLQDGHEVHLLLREGHQAWRLEEIFPAYQTTVGDVANKDAVRRCMAAAKPDWVFHLSAYGAYSSQTGFQQMIATNVVGCANLFDACLEQGVEALVQTGSSSEYGLRSEPTREDMRVEPNSDYAITKAAATHYFQFHAKARNFRASTARLYSIYGPYEEPTRLIPTLLVHCLQGKLPPLVSPHIARDFVYIDDAVEALIRIASAAQTPPGLIYNVSSGIQTTILEIVDQAKKLFDVTAKPTWGGMASRSWDTGVWVGDCSAISRDLGWHAETSLHDGLKKTADWLQEKPDRLRYYQASIFK